MKGYDNEKEKFLGFVFLGTSRGYIPTPSCQLIS